MDACGRCTDRLRCFLFLSHWSVSAVVENDGEQKEKEDKMKTMASRVVTLVSDALST